ncbi:MAG: proliferating cell nuclear antigen (pcna) [Nanoarchaeota archaeon]|nr:proliferating cell nuclear antigen (pcna) [Nanoarchaeota archaeon]
MVEPIFYFKLENSKIFSVIVETLNSIIDECIIDVSSDELQINAMDPSRICLIRLTMKQENFDVYTCKNSEKIGLNLDDLTKILKRSNNKDILEFGYYKKDSKIRMQFCQEGQTRKRTFSLATIDTEQEDIPMENLLSIEYPSTFDMDTDIISEALKDAEIYSEILNMKADEENGIFFSSSGQIGEMEYDLSIEDLIESEITGISNGAYSLLFLKSILKISSITERLEVSLKTDHPLKMIFSILEGSELSYFLAPRCEDADFVNDEELDEF